LCDGREGNPGEYRDYRLKLNCAERQRARNEAASVSVRD
jgi:hypothetical protein